MSFEFMQASLDACIAKYDLLSHPYYKAWTKGELSCSDISVYASNYYHFIAAFPGYLDELLKHLQDGPTRSAVLQNRADEEGGYSDGRPHTELWLDFAEGMGVNRDEVKCTTPIPEIQVLIKEFARVVESGSTAEAIAALYAFESQQPRVSEQKAYGLKQLYHCDNKTCAYFTTHTLEDAHHAKVWVDTLIDEVSRKPESRQAALNAAEVTAKLLWNALDGVEHLRCSGQPV